MNMPGTVIGYRLAAICPACKQERKLRRDGKFARHRKLVNGAWKFDCEGSNTAPARTSAPLPSVEA